MGYVEAEFCGGAEKGKDIKGWFGKVNFMLWMTDDLKNEYYFFLPTGLSTVWSTMDYHSVPLLWLVTDTSTSF